MTEERIRIIRIRKSTYDVLNRLKADPSDSEDDVIRRMLEIEDTCEAR